MCVCVPATEWLLKCDSIKNAQQSKASLEPDAESLHHSVQPRLHKQQNKSWVTVWETTVNLRIFIPSIAFL